jgi:hypothetical protein
MFVLTGAAAPCQCSISMPMTAMLSVAFTLTWYGSPVVAGGREVSSLMSGGSKSILRAKLSYLPPRVLSRAPVVRGMSEL